MLQYSAIDKGTLELLRSLMQQDFLTDFNLVGGTALALHIGHRNQLISIYLRIKNLIHP
jgi:hypothetical protein